MEIRKNGITMLWILIASASYGQNLVPNYDFENNLECPSQPSQLRLAMNWIVPSFGGTPDYFCKNVEKGLQSKTLVNVPGNFAGSQNPFDGKCYAGLFFLSNENFSQREYIQFRLKSPLKKGKTYAINLQTSFADHSNFTVDFMTVCFSKTSNLKLNRQFLPTCENSLRLSLGNSQIDSLKWVEVKNAYLAEGGEQYCTIGLFSDLTKSAYTKWVANVINPLGRFGTNRFQFAYYYIDSVSVIEDGTKIEFSHEND